MLLTLAVIGHLHILWGGPPGPQPTPPSACRPMDEADFIGERRVHGDPRGPGGPPHDFCRMVTALQSKWHWMLSPAQFVRSVSRRKTVGGRFFRPLGASLWGSGGGWGRGWLGFRGPRVW